VLHCAGYHARDHRKMVPRLALFSASHGTELLLSAARLGTVSHCLPLGWHAERTGVGAARLRKGARAASAGRTPRTVAASSTEAHNAGKMRDHLTPREGRVLSIQSTVVHGYVGNKSAVFPLQTLGLDVDPINTVSLSNHKGYPSFGSMPSLDERSLRSLLTGLKDNNLIGRYTHLLAGYIGNGSLVAALADAYRELKRHNPDMLFVCDPVLGDNGRLYVAEDTAAAVAHDLLPLCDVLTPNQFECELLSGIPIRAREDAIRAMGVLHDKGPDIVLLSSCSYHHDPKRLEALVSCKENGIQRTYAALFPKIEGHSFTGTGDVTAAVFLAWLWRMPRDPCSALEYALSTIQMIVRETADRGGGELRLIQCGPRIPKPRITVDAVRVARPKTAIRGLIFDMDGTLTKPGQLDFRKIREQLGLDPTQDIVQSLRSLPQQQQTSAESVVEALEVEAMASAELMDGCAEVLQALRSEGYKLGISTRSCLKAVEEFLRVAGLPDTTFDTIVTRNYKAVKPQPEVALDICSGWGLSPEEVRGVAVALILYNEHDWTRP